MNWRDADLITDVVIRIFHCLYSSSRRVALGSTRPLTEMSSRADNLNMFMCQVSKTSCSLNPLGVQMPLP